MDDNKAREMAAAYACCKMVGLNKRGEEIWSADNEYKLAMREVRMNAFLAGFAAGREEAAKVCEQVTKAHLPILIGSGQWKQEWKVDDWLSEKCAREIRRGGDNG